MGKPPSHPGKLSFLLLSGQEMNISQSALQWCSVAGE